MAMLVTLPHAKRQLDISSEVDDVLVVSKIRTASDIILDYLTDDLPATAWTFETVPLRVQSAVLVMLTHLWEHRGDDMAPDEAVWQAVDRVLARTRTPVIA